MDISIIILNYKSKGFTLNCVKSILEADWTSPLPSPSKREGKLRYEIIVVDNNSQDAIGEILAWQYPQVKFIQNKKNLGMGAGNNAGLKKAQGNYVVVMNPDTLAFKDAFVKLFDYMEANKEVGAAGPRQLNPDKTIQDSCYHWPSLLTPIYRRTPLGNFKFAQKDLDRYLMRDFDRREEEEVDWLLGSFLFIRKKALDKVGLFDERFFLYFEDTDLCQRFWQKGWKVVYYPKAEIIHNHSRASAEIPWYKFFWNRAARHHVLSWVKYLVKWNLTNPKF